MPERTKPVIEAKNYSLLPETEFFNTIGRKYAFNLKTAVIPREGREATQARSSVSDFIQSPKAKEQSIYVTRASGALRYRLQFGVEE